VECDRSRIDRAGAAGHLTWLSFPLVAGRDFTDDDLSSQEHAWLDQLTQECALDFAAGQGYDLKDYVHGGCVADWWGFT
jgi:hypothetical protein